MQNPLFSGPTSVRHPRERLAFVGTLLWAFPAAAALGFFIHESIGESQVALFIVIAMVYVTLARGRLLGSSVMIHETQYPRVFAIVKRACAALEIPMPLIFVREDYQIPVVALGFGEPYSLVLSSHWIEHFEDDELAFIIGRQLGHIAAGHTRYLSLLSVNGNENAVVALIFGPWLRACELTCDKVGLLVCGSLDAAARAIAVASFHHFGRQVNIEQFAEQGREIANDSILRWGEWLGGEPYATRRISDMRRYIASVHFQQTEDWFLREEAKEPPHLPIPGELEVERADCAGWWRRFTAVLIDAIVVTALIGAFTGEPNRVKVVSDVPAAASSTVSARDASDDTLFHFAGLRIGVFGAHVEDPNSALGRIVSFAGRNTELWLLALYLFVLVGLAGQSFGMMITGLRVVNRDFRPPGIVRTLLRYVVVMLLWPLIAVLSVIQHRIMLHDILSGTRLITTERAMARAATSLAPANA